MPGYIIHLTAAEILWCQTDFFLPSEKNLFLAGNLMPDGAKDKVISHYRDPNKNHYMIQWPQLKWFLEDSRHLKKDALWWGYFYHLYVDHCFFKNFLPRIALFYNDKGELTNCREEISYVHILKTNKKVDREQFFSEEYYYGDFTSMNSWLMKTYHLTFPIVPRKRKGKIGSTAAYEVEKVLKQLKEYTSQNTKKTLKVFQEKLLISFLEETATEFRNAFLLKTKRREL